MTTKSISIKRAGCKFGGCVRKAVELNEPIDWLKAHGVEATGHGDTVEQIASYAKKWGVDLIVLRRYPPASGGSWWSSERSGSLAERANCCVMVAVDEPTASAS